MANRFMENMKEEAKNLEESNIKAEAKKINEANKRFIESIKPNTLIETVNDVKSGNYYSVKTANGFPIGLGGHCSSSIIKINGRYYYVCGDTEKERKEDENYIRLAVERGDIRLPSCMGIGYSGRYVMRVVYICGFPVLTKGHTEEERVQDENAAREQFAKLRNCPQTDVLTAEEIVEAGLNPTREFEKDGNHYIYFEDQKCARTFDGKKVADISDIKDELSVDTAIELLKARI